MFSNNFKITIRNLWKHKVFSAINIFGLAIGIATCLLITLFVQNEFSYDRYNTKADQIVRVTFRGKMNGGEIKEANVMPPVAQAFKKDFPEVLDATRIRNIGMPRITYGDKMFRDNSMAFVDSNFLNVFTLLLIDGNVKTALLQPNTVIISKAAAKAYFDNENPVGKVLSLKDNNTSLTVTGVFNEVPVNSHFHFDLLASMSTLPEATQNDWMISNYYTYLVLPKGYDYRKLQAKLPAEADKYISPQLQKAMGISMSQFRKSGNDIGFVLQPLKDIHLHSDLTGDMEPAGNSQSVYIFGAIAIFVLLIACINFMNLSTAGASKRAKEVGIRKVLGSAKLQLVRQFLLESLLLTGVALLIAVALVYLSLPLFNSLAGADISIQLKHNAWIIPALLAFGLFTSILAGSYPAFFLSSFNPIAVLKSGFTSGKKSVSLRSSLVVFQFFIAVGLIIGTIIVYRQLSFMQGIALGYDKNQVAIIQESYWLGNNQQAFKQELLQDPRVLSVSSSGYLPAGNSNVNNFLIYADNNSTQLVNTLRYEVDNNYIPTLGMQMSVGRNFSSQYGTDSTAVIINETAARTFGWNQYAIGHTVTRQDNDGTKRTYHVIGIIKDFHFKSLHQLITPLVMTMNTTDNSNIIVKVKAKEAQGLLSSMKVKWDHLTTQSPFTYSFLDDRYNNTYKAEQNVGRILIIFSSLTILVACLGLFGLTIFTSEQRRKEIGIRKVLGANTAGIVSLLSKDFLRLVIISIVIAVPVSLYTMNKWLQDFAYRITISWWMFALAGGTAVCIALLTMSYQSVKAAVANPVKSLRTE